MKVFEDELLIRAKDCDLNGTWRLSAVLEAMQEAAGDHSTLLGCGRETIVRTGIVWVLVRSEVRMDRYPAIGEKVHDGSAAAVSAEILEKLRALLQ